MRNADLKFTTAGDYMSETRKATNRLLEMVGDDLLDKYQVILACVKYMSEDDVADMCHLNGFFEEEDEDLEDDFNYAGSRHHY